MSIFKRSVRDFDNMRSKRHVIGFMSMYKTFYLALPKRHYQSFPKSGCQRERKTHKHLTPAPVSFIVSDYNVEPHQPLNPRPAGGGGFEQPSSQQPPCPLRESRSLVLSFHLTTCHSPAFLLSLSSNDRADPPFESAPVPQRSSQCHRDRTRRSTSPGRRPVWTRKHVSTS